MYAILLQVISLNAKWRIFYVNGMSILIKIMLKHEMTFEVVAIIITKNILKSKPEVSVSKVARERLSGSARSPDVIRSLASKLGKC